MTTLDDLERLERAATAGRHTTGEAEHDAIPYVGIGYTDEVYALDSADPHEPVATFERPEDAALYAAARNALPALLAGMKALEALCDAVDDAMTTNAEAVDTAVRAGRAALAALEGKP